MGVAVDSPSPYGSDALRQASSTCACAASSNSRRFNLSVMVLAITLRASGLTALLPDDDRIEVSREWCIDTITLSLGGRAAEQLILNRIGSGAQNDIKNASELARKMVTQWGMSEQLGPIAYGDHHEQVFLGKEFATRLEYSETTSLEIDREIKNIVMNCYERAKKLLTEHEDQLHRISQALLERESLDAEDIKILLNNGTLPPNKKSPNQQRRERVPESAPGGEETAGDEIPPGSEGLEPGNTGESNVPDNH